MFMTVQEAAKLVFTIKATYPKYFAKYSKPELDNMINIWARLFRDIPYEKGSIGLEVYLTTETDGFPPSPGQVIDCIQKAEPQSMNEIEAWGLVRMAIRDGIYHAEEHFKELPPDCQKAVGRPGQLTEWAMLKSSEVDTIAAAQFKRVYTAEIKRRREEAKMPQEVRERLATIQREALIDSSR
jgi:hypothetical protein